MDATTRWETEAMRSSPQKRSKPPRPTAKREAFEPGSGTFVTLKEAEEATGIPTNTLRKWVRKEAITSYLESDGELTLRMVELDSVKHRAQELGRHLAGTDTTQSDQEEQRATPAPSPAETEESTSEGSVRASEPPPPAQHGDTPEGSMLVPIDAWNKMLTQLGNLHEAGQQLAEARERAAKAETEAVFLRERLAEIRSQTSDVSEAAPSPLEGGQVSEASQGGLQAGETGLPAEDASAADEASGPATTSYWRYLTTGWRSRKKR
ncbi:MAG: hypothetical protein DWP92_05695 [Armatimonadetes bacterium]|nr:MAG: hypothetical protein DWP92_05695 [Armatimonadota bacterium]